MINGEEYAIIKKIKVHTKPLRFANVIQRGTFKGETSKCYVFDGFKVKKDLIEDVFKRGENMYKSPISITEEICSTILEQKENEVLKYISKMGIHVDKSELIKALRFDRNQYDKGFYDGVLSVVDKLTSDFSQSDILCPRKIISITESRLKELVSDLLGGQYEQTK